MNKVPLKFLMIRRDNIGDLVCTTPLFTALRAHYPNAEICALVNSYNAPVLENHPEIDAVYVYTKAKHRTATERLLGVYWRRLQLFLALRRKHFDYAILAAPHCVPRALKLARMARPRHIIGFIDTRNRPAAIDIAIPYGPPAPIHETEDIFRLLAPLGITEKPQQLRVYPDPAQLKKVAAALGHSHRRQRIGIHISARKPSQRWPSQNVVELIRILHERHQVVFALFWSPGEPDNPLHPGDDDKARQIIDQVTGLPVTAMPTNTLNELIAGISMCDAVICSDGGAMHLAAGLEKPILCFFGKSDSTRWHPWGVPYALLQPPSLNVADIDTNQAAAAFTHLWNQVTGENVNGCSAIQDRI